MMDLEEANGEKSAEAKERDIRADAPVPNGEVDDDSYATDSTLDN